MGFEMGFEFGLIFFAIFSLAIWFWRKNVGHRQLPGRSTPEQLAEDKSSSVESMTEASREDSKESDRVTSDKDLIPHKRPLSEPLASTHQETAESPVVEHVEPVESKDFGRATDVPSEQPKRSVAEALASTKKGIFGRIRDLVLGHGGLQGDDLEELEEILYTSDLGPRTVQHLMAAMEDRLKGKGRSNLDTVRNALRLEMSAILQGMPQGEDLSLPAAKELQVIMVVGVNGAGKTTTIGKLASRYMDRGLRVLIAAGDTFRAAADSQLKVWCDRAGVDIFSPENVKDPSAVAFDACQMAAARKYDVLIIDTAGRLHTQKNLMEELKKMRRVVTKVNSEAPHEVLLVLDANSGQNALIQAKEFHEALGVTGVILTKLDGTAKGGVVLGLVHELNLPIRLIGVGEGIDDLRPFSADEFVDSIL
jgi:fused signal recognition particle receptor